jgi:lipoprotein-releasing system ATP-binding protein
MMERTIVLSAQHIVKYFRQPEPFKVLDDISLEINAGEFVAIMGKSGCGKSTLLYILSTMDTDYQGELFLQGKKITGLSQNELAHIRNRNIGFVFQFHFLLPEFTVLQNVMAPARKAALWSIEEIEHRAMEKLQIMDIADQALKPARNLSGGQQQRAAIARALINEPIMIIGDEPTGNLDSANTMLVSSLLRSLADEKGQTIICVTHDAGFASGAHRILTMKDGMINGEQIPDNT